MTRRQNEDKIVVGKTATLEQREGRIYLHPNRRRRDADKQTHYGTEDYVEPFDIDADWEERA